MRTNQEIDAEINALHRCTQRLRKRYSPFGDDYVAAIGVQICVLQQRLSMRGVQRNYGEPAAPAEPHNEHQAFLSDKAWQAWEWLNLDDQPYTQPSGPDGWGGLCVPPVPQEPSALDAALLTAGRLALQADLL